MLCGTIRISLLGGRAYFLGLLGVPLAHSTELSALPGILLAEERLPFPWTCCPPRGSPYQWLGMQGFKDLAHDLAWDNSTG